MFTRARFSLMLLFVAVAMTFLFWWPLYGGAGFIGGDLYPYFFPQKAFLADQLKGGEFPIWNDLSGFGYPVLGESQTGAAYPFHVLFYRLFDLNTAYNIEHLLHVWLVSSTCLPRMGHSHGSLASGGTLVRRIISANPMVAVCHWSEFRDRHAVARWTLSSGIYHTIARRDLWMFAAMD